MARAREIDGLTPDQPFISALARIITTRSAEMWSFAPETIAGSSEALRSMRIASRRLRAAIEVAETCYRRKEYTAFHRTITELTERLGGVRDIDMVLDRLKSEADQAPADEQTGIADLAMLLTTRRESLRPLAIPMIEALLQSGFPERFERFFGHVKGSGRPAPTDCRRLTKRRPSPATNGRDRPTNGQHAHVNGRHYALPRQGHTTRE